MHMSETNNKSIFTTQIVDFEGLGIFWDKAKQYIDTLGTDIVIGKGDAENSAVLKGGNNQTTSECEVALGKYNASNYDTQFSIGIGTSEDDRKNAFEVKQNGDIYIEGVEGRIQDKLDKLVEITYSELKSLRDDSKLIPGQQYRITDYVTTTTQENTRSTGHQFDVIVTADDENTLNAAARACLYKEDTYFSEAGAKLEAWQIWYSLDNDAEKFAWADTENGKGVIYRMIDEWNNDCPYDFKNIQFKRNLNFDNGHAQFSEDGEETWVYTFAGQSYHINNDEWSGMLDGSLESPFGHMSDENTSTFHDNVIKPYTMLYNGNDIRTECGIRYLNGIVFLGHWESIGSANDEDVPYYYAYCCYSNSFENDCHSNSLGNRCNNNSFGEGCSSNSFGDECGENSFGNGFSSNSFGNSCTNNSFGDYCYFNSFGNYCHYNTFGESCQNNTLGEGCNSNSLGNRCHDNSFVNNCCANSLGNDCYKNSFGGSCSNNSFGNDCHKNSFGGSCSNNSFGNGCFLNSFGNGCNCNSFSNEYYGNSFGNHCYSNSFGNSCFNNSFGNYCSNNSFENGCGYNSFRLSPLTTASLKNYCHYNHFDDGCSYNVIWNSDTTSSSKLLKNINVNRGVSGTSSEYNKYNFININTIGSEQEINVNQVDGIVSIGEVLSIRYESLRYLRDNSQLIPGRQYRIIDYNTTTSQENTTSAGHPFDIIVTAIDKYTLSEEAQAAQNHNNDNGYFDDSNLSAWKIWYSLDNDTDRFEWAGDERIETTTVETIVADSSECTIKSELIDGNTFITPFNFESCVWVDGDGDGVITYDGGSNHDEEELIYEWGYFTDENDNTHLCIYKSDAGLYEEEGQPDYGDKYLYRGVIDVDGTDYDYWQKWDASIESIDINGIGDYVFATTARIVSNPEAYSSETTTETIETVIPLEPKGVIYRMIDEFGNDLPYDFKNIMFVRYELEAPEEYIAEGSDTLWMQQLCNNVRAMFDEGVRPFVWAGIADEDKCWEDDMSQILSHTTGNNFAFFTFNTDEDTDASLSGDIRDNKMQLSQTLPNNVFFGNSCDSNSFGNYCNYNSFGNDCDSNSFGNYCYYNSFGNDCDSNSFGKNCYSNSFGNNCDSNSFGNYCYYNSFGKNCYYNSFGNYCYYNSFGKNCYSNSFGNNCYYNSFGKNCYYNSFGNSCGSNSFRTSASTTSSLKDYCHYNHFDDGCSYNVIWNSDTTSSSVLLKNINVNRGVSGKSSAYNYINIDTLNADYEIQVAKNSKGEIKIYCEADLIA